MVSEDSQELEAGHLLLILPHALHSLDLQLLDGVVSLVSHISYLHLLFSIEDVH